MELADYRRQRGVEPDMVMDDLQFVRTLITYAVSRAAALSAGLTAFFLVAGIILSTLGNLVGAGSSGSR
ncbi:hypothetical protein [Micromonospora sp. NPDC126480]|uniref:hypothetical protein n=1 Tax=Micromonospora sp. NPDC126480 TaxID=3155312 RepID=UPI003326DCE5